MLIQCVCARIKRGCLRRSDILTCDWLNERDFELLVTILREKQSTVAFFVGSALKSNFHWKVQFFMIV